MIRRKFKILKKREIKISGRENFDNLNLKTRTLGLFVMRSSEE